MKCYKGFDKNLSCRGFQYEVGKTYETDEAKLCESGFHACEAPLDVFSYYPPTDGSRYCKVDLDATDETRNGDTKRVGKKITIGAEINLLGLARAHVEWVKSKIEKTKANTGDRSAATNTGNWSAATNTGNWSAATNTGNQSAATNTGNQSAATNTGDRSAATNTGNWSAATNTGDRSAATNTGNWSAATNTGNWSAATNTGNWSAATNTGGQSAATNTGNQSAATNTGNWSAATNTGNRSAATNTGDRSAATVSGKDSIAIACGYDSKARGSLGCAIVVAERGEWNGSTYPLLHICAAIVDGEKIKSDTWYTAKEGKLVEVEENAENET